MQLQVFLSYSHQDEWLKVELEQHLAGLKRSGAIDVWHDREITAGQIFSDEIATRLRESHIIILLVSSAFVNSDYCVDKEYLTAKDMHQRGEAIVIPVIVRECDWDVHGLREFQALPTDADAVTKGRASREDAQERDGKWLDVVQGLKRAIAQVKKNSLRLT
jgi:hypothetical protein